jgi:beta-barrel assembly-enhancing protease
MQRMRDRVGYPTFVASILTLVVATPVAAITLISVQDEIAIGREASRNIRKQVPEFADETTRAYVRSLGSRLAKVAPGPKYPYSLSIADYREINAFALPGGPVWINRGVLHTATNESQVAGVLAHEIAHIAQRHAADQITKGMIANFGLGVLGALLGNSGGAGAAQAAAGLGANLWFLKFSRDDEQEADRAGLRILRRAGWDGRGMIELFQMLGREQGRNPGAVEVFLSSHPAPHDRFEALRAQAARARGGVRDTPRFHAVKARLLKIAAPRPMPRG